jgi:transcriptional regulator with XRE-family HTH domain
MHGAILDPMVKKEKPLRRTYIREWRKSRGLTLEQLAERIEMTSSHLSMLERGQRGYAQETLEAIAHALHTDPGSLLMRNPGEDGAMWSIWENALPGERRMIADIAKTITKKTGS